MATWKCIVEGSEGSRRNADVRCHVEESTDLGADSGVRVSVDHSDDDVVNAVVGLLRRLLHL